MLSLEKCVFDPKAKTLTVRYSDLVEEWTTNIVRCTNGEVPQECKIYGGSLQNIIEVESHVTGIVKTFIYLKTQTKHRCNPTDYNREMTYWKFYPAAQSDHAIVTLYVVDDSMWSWFKKLELKPWNQVVND